MTQHQTNDIHFSEVERTAFRKTDASQDASQKVSVLLGFKI